jgi:serine/threonine protein kinase
MTPYPSAVDYTLALQNPAIAFADASLQAATFTQGLMGPYGIAGTSAVVFHATIAGEDHALRCYTREDASTPERYAALDRFVSENGLSKFVGTVTWHVDEVRVKDKRWPVLKMDWIAGQQLNEYVGYLADNGNTAALRTLAERWLDLVNELQRVRFAHGDLQHGNILVDRQGHLRLVDFDSMWIPPLQGQAPPTESGHTSYQSQSSGAKFQWGPHMDTFSGLVIYLALTALARDPALWPKLNNGDNLLFERADFSPPYETSVWIQLAGLGDAEVDRVAVKLKECCAPGWIASKSLRDMLARTWWEQPGVAASTGTTAQAATPSKEPSSSMTGPASRAVSAPTQWYASAVPSQHTAATGSLPPPPTTPYQSTVAQQSGATPPGTLPGKSGSTGNGQSWWGQQHGAPTTASNTPPTPNASPSSARALSGGMLVVVAVIAFIALFGNNHPALGTVIGLAVGSAGVWLARSKPGKPPGNPPAAGGTPGR